MPQAIGPSSAPTVPPGASADTVFAALAHIGFAATMEDVWGEFCARMEDFGFDRLNYSYTPSLHDPENISRSTRFTLSSHRDPRVARIYRDATLDRSPMRIWAARNVGSVSWREQPRLLREYGMVEHGPALNDLLADLGIRAGYTIGLPATGGGGKGALGLTARPGLDQDAVDAIWDRHGLGIETLARAAHGRLSRLPIPLETDPITARQREILGWIADGKAMQDVAVLTGLSQSAVEKYLARARDRLGVETTAQALARLALLNQLDLPGAD